MVQQVKNTVTVGLRDTARGGKGVYTSNLYSNTATTGIPHFYDSLYTSIEHTACYKEKGAFIKITAH